MEFHADRLRDLEPAFTGDHDISAFVNVENVAALNNLIEEIRTVQGVKRTETRMVLKKYNGNNK